MPLHERGGDKSQVNVAVNNQVGVVVTEAKRAELQAKLRELQDGSDNSEKQCPAPITLPAPQTQPQANVGTENSPSGAPIAVQASISPSLRALGFDLAMPESEFSEAEPVRGEPRGRNSVGW